nr:sugar phosphate isomerase/epimerase [Clostridia bacterium]
RNTHCKDGFYPTDGHNLGKEVALGEGKANFPAIVKKFKELGYTGPYVIEREISGEQQTKDIIMARDMIRRLVAEA